MNREKSSTSGTTHWTKVTERPPFKLSLVLDQWGMLFMNIAYRQVAAVYPQ